MQVNDTTLQSLKMDVDGFEIMPTLSPFCITIGHEISGIHLERELPKKHEAST